MNLRVFNTMDQVQTALLDEVSRANTASPRNKMTRELIAYGFVLEHPRNRIIYSNARSWSLPLAIGELAWHLSGSDNLEQIAYYASIWRKFSEDGEKIRGSCYGKKIFSRSGASESQWDRLVRLLKHDPNSRRAVLNMQDEQDTLDALSPDVPCVTSCQFLIRDKKLDVIVNMRSNDVIWGLPYDVFLFSMFQEMLAIELNIGLGRYYHFAGSMHLYERHFNLAAQILEEGENSGPGMRPMEALEEIPHFLAAERQIRTGTAPESISTRYWSELLEVVRDYAARRAA